MISPLDCDHQVGFDIPAKGLWINGIEFPELYHLGDWFCGSVLNLEIYKIVIQEMALRDTSDDT